MRATVHTAETPPTAVRCAWRVDGGAWRACRLDASGTAVLRGGVAARARVTVVVRVVDSSGRSFTTRRVLRA